MSDTLVHLTRGDDGVAVIRIDNGKVNALSTAVLGQIEQIARELQEDPPGVVVITGNGRMFAAGADISEFDGPDEAAVVGLAFVRALNQIELIPRIVIAAVDGFALGGGCELALACDLRVCTERARFGQPEILLGIIPGGGGTQRLARLVGPSRAKDLNVTGRQVAPEEALRIGLVDEVVPTPDDGDHAAALEAAVMARATALASGAVVAQGLAKRAIDQGLDLSLAEGLQLEHQLVIQVFGTDDAAVGVASFREHGPGKAQFTGR